MGLNVKPVLIVLPTYDEAPNIKKLISKLRLISAGLEKYRFEILVVDDSSPDGTGRVVAQMQKTDKFLHLLSGRRQGLGRAYIRGLQYGLKLKTYHVVVLMDADFSHDPKHIPRLLAALDAGSDYAIGSRYVSGGSTANWPSSRNLKSHLANAFARWMLDLNDEVKDMTGGFKAIRVSALDKIDLSKLKASGFVFQVNLLHEFARRDLKITEVPIDFVNRVDGKSKMRLADMLEFVILTFRLNPHSRIRQLIRFCFVGASGTLVNLAVLFGLVHFAGLSPPVGFIIALETSIISNFLLNHFYTFSFRAKPREALPALIMKLSKYNLVALAGAGISFAVFYLLYRAGLHYIIADLTAIATATAWNFWLSVKVVWKIVDE